MQSSSEEKSARIQPQKQQSVKTMISLVEKALKIGVPVVFAIFTGTFFTIGFYLQNSDG